MGRNRKKRAKQKPRRTEKAYTPLGQHQLIGKGVVPPFGMLRREAPVELLNWTNERLPEMLWSALLTAGYGRDTALDLFRRVAGSIAYTVDADESKRVLLRDVTLTGLSQWSDEDFARFADIVVRPTPNLFACLVGFNDLPGRERWEAVIGQAGDRNNLEQLTHAVALTAFHQSQEATDCRWARVIAAAASGSIYLPVGAENIAREIEQYPDFGDMRSVRPNIRTFEMMLDMPGPGGERHRSAWSESFWKEAFEKTASDHPRLPRASLAFTVSLTRDELSTIRADVVAHCVASTSDTSVDAKREAAFGLVIYSIDILSELLVFGNATSIVGRMALRALVEARITLAYLSSHPDQKVWEKYRSYGAGQAKLTYLKLLDTDVLPEFVTIDDLEILSNEDMWHEFREITIGNWAGSDLRKMSEAAALKASVYDNFYDWTSAFIHANWASLRNAAYDLCVNPLHRLHRVLTEAPASLPDVVSDGWRLVHGMLEDLARLYPGLTIPAAPPVPEGAMGDKK